MTHEAMSDPSDVASRYERTYGPRTGPAYGPHDGGSPAFTVFLATGMKRATPKLYPAWTWWRVLKVAATAATLIGAAGAIIALWVTR